MPENITNEAEAKGSDSGEAPKGNEGFKAINSQEEFDAAIQSRLARERGKFADYGDLKTQVEGFETSKQEAIEAAKAEIHAEYAAGQVSNEVLNAAKALNFNDAEDALAVLKEELPLKDGKPDLDEITTRVTALAEAKPYLVAAPAGGPKPRPKPKTGEKVEGDDDEPKGRGRAVAALRQFSTR